MERPSDTPPILPPCSLQLLTFLSLTLVEGEEGDDQPHQHRQACVEENCRHIFRPRCVKAGAAVYNKGNKPWVPACWILLLEWLLRIWCGLMVIYCDLAYDSTIYYCFMLCYGVCMVFREVWWWWWWSRLQLCYSMIKAFFIVLLYI